MEHLSSCLVCGSKKIINKKSLIDYALTKEKFSLYQCLSCGVLFTNPRPNTLQFLFCIMTLSFKILPLIISVPAPQKTKLKFLNFCLTL